MFAPRTSLCLWALCTNTNVACGFVTPMPGSERASQRSPKLPAFDYGSIALLDVSIALLDVLLTV